MEICFAPLEGITGFVYRNAYEKCFGGISQYYAPFASPIATRSFTTGERFDVVPENNQKINLVPQLLSNNAEQFSRAADELAGMGYKEINLNAGCPAKTVVTRGKGSGMLKDTEALDNFLYKIFEKQKQAVTYYDISVKTRIGMYDTDEFSDILHVYNRYPISELIIHPRLQNDYYKNKPNMEAFEMAIEESAIPVCYNGDIKTVADIEKFAGTYPGMKKVMIGRGLISNPFLTAELSGGRKNTEQIFEFHTELINGYKEWLSGDTNVLFRIKELWLYLKEIYEDGDKIYKAIKKMKNLGQYESMCEIFLRSKLVF